MKVIFKVFGLEEKSFLTGVRLSENRRSEINGIDEDGEAIVVRNYQASFDSKDEAMAFISKCDIPFDHGFEIVETHTNTH